jgi:hypothetical protein
MSHTPTVARICAALLAGAATCGGLRAQASRDAGTPQGLGTIRGVIYDSLIQKPLAGAYVSLLHRSLGVETDPRGRFVLDSVPAGRQVITFSHPDLDSIGLSDFATAVTVTAGAATVVQLGVPSHEAFRRSACGVDRAWRDSAVVYGTVFDAQRRARLSGARVRVQWPAVSRDDSGRFVVHYPAGQVRSDSLGRYYVCGVPADYLVAAQAQAGPFSSGQVDVLVGPRAIARRDLSISREPAADADSAARGVPLRMATVLGTVRDEHARAVAGAYATLDDVPAGAATDAAGSFQLRNLPAGTRMLMVRQVGYFAERLALDLRNRDTTRIAVVLRAATVLDTLRVVASPRLQAELEDMQRRIESGFGYFLSSAEIKQRTNARSLFEGLPAVQTEGSDVNNFQILMRSPAGYCQPSVFLDGLRSDVETLPSLQLKNLAAVEIYPRLSPGLYRYITTGNQECGVVLIWTKYTR